MYSKVSETNCTVNFHSIYVIYYTLLPCETFSQTRDFVRQLFGWLTKASMNEFPKINVYNFPDTVLVYMFSFNTWLLLNWIDDYKWAIFSACLVSVPKSRGWWPNFKAFQLILYTLFRADICVAMYYIISTYVLTFKTSSFISWKGANWWRW